MLKKDGLSAEKAQVCGVGILFKTQSVHIGSQHIQSILEYAGADQRMEDIFLNKDILAKTKNVFKGLKVARTLLLELRFTHNKHRALKMYIPSIHPSLYKMSRTASKAN
jgi:hypothetical protein